MRTRGVAIAAVSVFIASGGALAQVVSQDVEAKPLFSGDRVVGCSVEYAAAIRDHTYRRGALSGVSGNVTLIAPQDGRPPGMMFKLLGMDFGDVSGSEASFFQVAEARVLVDDVKVGKGTRMPCENPKGQCSIHSADEWFKIIQRMMTYRKLSVIYSRQRGGLGVNVEITVAPEKMESLLTCVEGISP
jgi:hypothetical protein